jgi:hypothetical protein
MSERRIPFTAEDEDRIASASIWGIIAAVTALVSQAVQSGAAFLAGQHLVMWVSQGIALVLTALLSLWLIQACLAFRAVARTDVADKAFLLRGFDKLHHYFMTIGIIISVLIAAVAALFVLRLVLTSFRPAGLL